MSDKPAIAEILAKAALSTVPIGGPLLELISGLQSRREHVAENAVGAISERVGIDVLASALERDPELDALMWTALQSIVTTGLTSKRRLLEDVVVNAVNSDEPIDRELLQAYAIAELEAPHIRALARLVAAEDQDSSTHPTNAGPSNLEQAAAHEPLPVLAALVRTGTLYTGSIEGASGLYTVPDPKIGSVAGVSEFGRELLRELRDRGFDRS